MLGKIDRLSKGIVLYLALKHTRSPPLFLSNSLFSYFDDMLFFLSIPERINNYGLVAE